MRNSFRHLPLFSLSLYIFYRWLIRDRFYYLSPFKPVSNIFFGKMKEVKERFPMASSLITKKRIAKAFRDLLATREFDKISIVDIMESAGIRRQTFYNHFLDKYELLDWIFENDLTEYITNNLDFNFGPKTITRIIFFISNKSVTFIFNFLIFKGKITSMTNLSATVACLYQKF